MLTARELAAAPGGGTRVRAGAGLECHKEAEDGKSGNWVGRYGEPGVGKNGAPKRMSKQVTFARWPDMTLADARLRWAEIKKRLKAGQSVLQATGAMPQAGVLFLKDAEDWLEYNKPGWAPSTYRRNKYDVSKLTALHQRPSNKITEGEIVDLLRPIWKSPYLIASKKLFLIQRILDHARLRRTRRGDFSNVPHPCEGVLLELPKRPKHVPRHHPACKVLALRAFRDALLADNTLEAKLVLFVMLTPCGRWSEYRRMKWSHIKGDVWEIAPVLPDAKATEETRRKSGRGAQIPLTPEALALLDSIRPADWQPDDYIWTGYHHGKLWRGVIPTPPRDPKQMMTYNAMRELPVFKQFKCTLHGLRASFNNWVVRADLFTAWHIETELMLDHKVFDKTQSAYVRDTFLRRRRQLTEMYVTYLTTGVWPNGSTEPPQKDPDELAEFEQAEAESRMQYAVSVKTL